MPHHEASQRRRNPSFLSDNDHIKTFRTLNTNKLLKSLILPQDSLGLVGCTCKNHATALQTVEAEKLSQKV